jgi:hypothetical protein
MPGNPRGPSIDQGNEHWFDICSILGISSLMRVESGRIAAKVERAQGGGPALGTGPTVKFCPHELESYAHGTFALAERGGGSLTVLA